MSWLSNLQPDLVLGGSILTLTPDILRQQQLKGLVLDVDQTLVPMTTRAVSGELKQWVEEIRPVAELWLVSNNLSENRIGNIAKSLDLPYILGARKPSRRKLKKAVEAMNLPVQQIAMVGGSLIHRCPSGQSTGNVHDSSRADD